MVTMVYQKEAGIDSKVLPSTFWKRDTMATKKNMMIWWLIWWRWRWDSDLFTIEHYGGEDDDVVNGGDDGDLFTIEHDGGEDDDGHGERENKEAELGRAGLEDCFRTSYFLCLSLYTCSV